MGRRQQIEGVRFHKVLGKEIRSCLGVQVVQILLETAKTRAAGETLFWQINR